MRLVDIFSSILKEQGASLIPPISVAPLNWRSAVSKMVDYAKSKLRISPDKVRLIFPLKKWEENALSLLKEYGIITGYFRSLDDALKVVDEIATKGIKAKELVIGSHGQQFTLLATQQMGGYMFDNSFLLSIKKIVAPNCKVFFTACNGADFLLTLKDAAEKLGVGAYGAAGLYDYVFNKADKGFYWCSAQKYTPPVKKRINAIKQLGNGLISVYLPKGGSSAYSTNVLRFTILVNRSVFGVEIPPIDGLGRVKEILKISDSKYNPIEIALYDFYAENYIYDYAKSKGSDNFFLRKNKEVGNVGEYIKNMINNGNIKIVAQTPSGEMDIMKIKPYSIHSEVDNDFLLQKGLCKKVERSPVSWF